MLCVKRHAFRLTYARLKVLQIPLSQNDHPLESRRGKANHTEDLLPISRHKINRIHISELCTTERAHLVAKLILHNTSHAVRWGSEIDLCVHEKPERAVEGYIHVAVCVGCVACADT